jgi:hypothetical protein
VNNAQAQAKVLTDAALEKAGELEKASDAEAKALLEDARKQADETISAAMSQAEEMAASAESYASGLISNAKENSDTLYYKLNSRSSVLLVEAERNAAILKQAVEEYADSKRAESEAQFSKLIGDAEEKSAEMLRSAKASSDAILKETEEKAAALLASAKERAEELTKVSETNSFLFIENAKQQAAGDSEALLKKAKEVYETAKQFAEKINAEAAGVRTNALRSAESLLSAAKSRAAELVAAAENAGADGKEFDVTGFIARNDTFDVDRSAVSEDLLGLDVSAPAPQESEGLQPGALTGEVAEKAAADEAAQEAGSAELHASVEALYEKSAAELEEKRGELNAIRATAEEGLASIGGRADEALDSVRKTKEEIEKLSDDSAPVYVARMELDESLDSIRKKYEEVKPEPTEPPAKATERIDMTLPEVALPDIEETEAAEEEKPAVGLPGGVVPDMEIKDISRPKISVPEIRRAAEEDDFDLESIDISAEVAAQEAMLEEQNRALSAASLINAGIDLEEGDFDSFETLEDFNYEELLSEELTQQSVETSPALQYIGRFEPDDEAVDEDGDPIVRKNEAEINGYVASVKDAISEQYPETEADGAPAYEIPVRIEEEEDQDELQLTAEEPAESSLADLLALAEETDDFEDISEEFEAPVVTEEEALPETAPEAGGDDALAEEVVAEEDAESVFDAEHEMAREGVDPDSPEALPEEAEPSAASDMVEAETEETVPDPAPDASSAAEESEPADAATEDVSPDAAGEAEPEKTAAGKEAPEDAFVFPDLKLDDDTEAVPEELSLEALDKAMEDVPKQQNEGTEDIARSIVERMEELDEVEELRRENRQRIQEENLKRASNAGVNQTGGNKNKKKKKKKH